MSTTIYNPYFYIIQHIQTGKYYAGVKYAKESNPNNLLKSNGYKTSSEIIKQIILEEGLESFIVRKIKVFDTGEEALAYESRFLRRINAAFNDNFLNRSNNSLSTLNVDYEKKKRTFLKNHGVENPFQSKEIQAKAKKTFLENYGVENPSQSLEVKEKKKQTCLENRGVEYSMQSEEVREKSKQTCLEKYGVENPLQSEDIREKSKKTCLEKYGVENPSQSNNIKEKKKQTNLEKLGVENPSQSEEINEKKRATLAASMNRPIVSEIRKYKEKFNLKLIPSWFYKKQEVLDNLFLELKMTYGTLNSLAQSSN